MSDQFNSALIRAVILAVCAGATTALTTWANTDDGKTIAVAGGTAFIAAFVARFGGEGAYDTHRDQAGEVHDGDVAPKPT